MLLKGEAIFLRTLEPKDADLVFRYENNSAFWGVSDTRIPFSRYSIEQYVQSCQDIYLSKQIRFLICLKMNEEVVGAIDLFEFDAHHQRAGVGILVENKLHRGKGFASEALDLLIEYSFSILLLNQLFCNVTTENEDSLNLFLNKGFRIIGIKKDWVRTISGYKDEYMLQLLNNHSI